MTQRTSPRLNANETIQHYRRRRGRTMPVLFAGLAVILLVGGVILIVSWLTGGNLPASLTAFLFTPTPTATLTSTPIPPTPTLAPTGTPSEIPTETLTPTPERPFTYTVELGDTLFGIAEKFDLDVLVLMAANAITDPGALSVGQQLTIPPADTELPTATSLPDNLRPGTLIEYTVQLGDTLQSIASEFNSTAERIAEENDIEDVNQISVGQVLRVPVKIVTPTPTPTITPRASATP